MILQMGMSESLAGRFLLHRMVHWDWTNMKKAFGFSMDEWVYFGGYPGAARMIDDEKLWRRYIRDALIEPTISRDVLQLSVVRKPALLRHLFYLACRYPAQILSYNKMLGQLTDAGNTTTLAHYLSLLNAAFLVTGLESFKPGGRQKRAGSPKLIVRNGALVSASTDRSYSSVREDRESWGRIIENAVGTHILNHIESAAMELFYWRDRDREVDFVVDTNDKLIAIEVKSSRMKSLHGLRVFIEKMPQASPLIVGGTGVPLERFLTEPPTIAGIS